MDPEAAKCSFFAQGFSVVGLSDLFWGYHFYTILSILALSMQQCVDLVLYQILAIMQDSIQSLLIREDRHAAVGFFSLTQVLKSDVFSFCKTFVFLENC